MVRFDLFILLFLYRDCNCGPGGFFAPGRTIVLSYRILRRRTRECRVFGRFFHPSSAAGPIAGREGGAFGGGLRGGGAAKQGADPIQRPALGPLGPQIVHLPASASPVHHWAVLSALAPPSPTPTR